MTIIIHKILILIIISMLFLTSCNIPLFQQTQGESGINIDDQARTMVALTMASMSKSGENETPQAPSQTSSSQPTETPTNALIPTEEPARVQVSVDTNCRTGPAKIFDYVGALLVGETADVIGKSSEGNYWIIKNPDAAGNCWLWGQYATVTGSTSKLVVYTPPPTPTPLFTWDGTWQGVTGEVGGMLVGFPFVITTVGSYFSGDLDFGLGNTSSFVGILDERHTTVSGTWSDGVGGIGTFNFYSLEANQFQGNITNDLVPNTIMAFCGSRGGAADPSPCYLP